MASEADYFLPFRLRRYDILHASGGSFDGWPDTPVVIIASDAEEGAAYRWAWLHFTKAKPLPTNYYGAFWNLLALFFPYDEFGPLMDTLRLESPVNLVWDAPTHAGFILTDPERVGEQEGT